MSFLKNLFNRKRTELTKRDISTLKKLDLKEYDKVEITPKWLIIWVKRD